MPKKKAFCMRVSKLNSEIEGMLVFLKTAALLSEIPAGLWGDGPVQITKEVVLLFEALTKTSPNRLLRRWWETTRKKLQIKYPVLDAHRRCTIFHCWNQRVEFHWCCKTRSILYRCGKTLGL